MKHILIFCFICLGIALQCNATPLPERKILNMNTDWAFHRGDQENGADPNLDDTYWIPVAIPHIMQLEPKHCGGNSIYDGIGWYRRYFTLPDMSTVLLPYGAYPS